jgi:hypothetical protein
MKKSCEINGERRTAIFSDCEHYRYTLEIVWDTLDQNPKLMQIVGLNPSTATESVDDPTLRRCKAFAKREGCGGLAMTNLFAWRDKLPSEMKKAKDPIGLENDEWLRRIAARCIIRVAAWGNHGQFLNRGRRVTNMIHGLVCFRLTGKSEPEHPLYMPADQPLIPFSYAKGNAV